MMMDGGKKILLDCGHLVGAPKIWSKYLKDQNPSGQVNRWCTDEDVRAQMGVLNREGSEECCYGNTQRLGTGS